jgi:ferritin-like metal-binding protein YciE
MLDQRREQGEELIEQLDEALDDMDIGKGRQKNIAAEGLIEDAQHLDEVEDEKLVDPLLLASVQKFEHHCIAAWGTAKSMGQLLGQDKVVKTMEQVLDDGKRYDEELTELAENEINPQMMTGEDEELEEMEDDEDEDGRGSSRGRKSGGSRRSKSH